MRKNTQRGAGVESTDFKPIELDTGSATLKTKSGGSSKSKKGGDLISDVKGLAVPFAILLAKQGLDMAMKKGEKKTTPSAKKTVKKVATSNRKATLAGGDCTLCNKKGGAKKATSEGNDIHDRFKVLSKQIDDFLKKY